MKNNKTTQRITGIAIFSALAFIVTVVFKAIPQVDGFLSLDGKDAIIAIASFIYGPIVAPVIALIVAFIEFLTISTTGWYGFIMNFASSAVFSLTASLIYKYRKSFTGALVGFLAATLMTTGVMILLNLIITPLYFGMPRSAVVAMLKVPIIPFNFAKTLMNSAIAMLLYKPIITALRRARLIEKGKHKTDFNKTTVITIVVGGVALVSSILIVVALNLR